jgi:hypothetical protein
MGSYKRSVDRSILWLPLVDCGGGLSNNSQPLRKNSQWSGPRKNFSLLRLTTGLNTIATLTHLTYLSSPRIFEGNKIILLTI